MKLSKISLMHIYKLISRSVLFLVALALYIASRIHGANGIFFGYEQNNIVLFVIWFAFLVEMVLRFFPSPTESMGCQKQFRRNYIPADASPTPHKGVFAVILSWVILNGIIAALYYTDVIDSGILLLIALFYSVCDMICILFYCPFQTLMMKNKCCTTCRIYNWDYAMMFTPLLFVRNFYAITLVLAALLLLIRWEVTALKFPERFQESQNENLHCKNCKEKLCHHKTQLQIFLKKRKGLH
ncbi:MAG: hypothetical protein IJC88_04730 [Oscillospiraceae bacterium]|nr:hypothetical protein [Oscillospiraceae bacterium]